MAERFHAPPTPRRLLGVVRREAACSDEAIDPGLQHYHEPWMDWRTIRTDLDDYGRRVDTYTHAKWVHVRCNNPDCPGSAWLNLRHIEDHVVGLVLDGAK